MTPRRKAAKPEAPAELVRIGRGGTGDLLHLEGVVGVAQAKRLQQVAIELARSGRRVSVRCEHLQQLDCASVQVLLALHAALKRKGVGMELQNLPDAIHQTLLTAGLASAF